MPRPAHLPARPAGRDSVAAPTNGEGASRPLIERSGHEVEPDVRRSRTPPGSGPGSPAPASGGEARGSRAAGDERAAAVRRRPHQRRRVTAPDQGHRYDDDGVLAGRRPDRRRHPRQRHEDLVGRRHRPDGGHAAADGPRSHVVLGRGRAGRADRRLRQHLALDLRDPAGDQGAGPGLHRHEHHRINLENGLSWQPGGTKILFTSNLPPGAASITQQLFTVPTTGGAATQFFVPPRPRATRSTASVRRSGRRTAPGSRSGCRRTAPSRRRTSTRTSA